MAATSIDTFDWDTIVDGIRSGRCVPFLGAAANISADGYEGLLLGEQVARRLLVKLVGEKRLSKLASTKADPDLADFTDLARLRADDLARVALHVQVRGGNKRLLDLLAEILPDEECEPSKLLTTLASLPLRLVVTTNYDRLMEEAFRRAKPPVDPFVVVQPMSGFKPRAQKALAAQLADMLPKEPTPRAPEERPIIYKIHGTFGEAGNPIVSEEDYIEFLDAVARDKKAGVPTLIQQTVVDSHLLFLGYSLEDWDFRTLWKGLVERLPREEKRVSFAIQKDPPPFWERFWDRKGITIYNLDVYEFAGQLVEELKSR